MEFFSEDYVVGVWFASDHEGNDFLMFLIKRKDEYVGEYRFRYRRDEKIFDSEDTKSRYSFKGPGDENEEQVINNLTNFFQEVRKRFNAFAEVELIQGNPKKMIEVLKTKPWANMKEKPLH